MWTAGLWLFCVTFLLSFHGYAGATAKGEGKYPYYIIRSVSLAVHRLLTVHHLVRVSVNLRVRFKVRVRDMVKLKFMDHG